MLTFTIFGNTFIHMMGAVKMFYQCEDCGDDVPAARREAAKFFSHLCVECAAGFDNAIKVRPTLVPTHKGAYQPVTNRRSLYEATCSPKNYDHTYAEKLS